MTTHSLQRRILVAGLLITIAGLIAASDALYEITEIGIVWTEATIAQAPLLGMLVFVLLAMISAMVAFFSSAFLAPIAVHAWGNAGAVAAFWLGWFLGGIASFCIGRFLGRTAAVTLIGEDKIKEWENQLSERTRFVHILLLQLAVPSEIPGYVLGILRYRFRWYVIALAFGEIPYAVAVVYLGSSFLQGESMVFILIGLVVVLGVFCFRSLRKSGNWPVN